MRTGFHGKASTFYYLLQGYIRLWAGREPKGMLGMPGEKQEAITIGYMYAWARDCLIFNRIGWTYLIKIAYA